MLGLIFLVIAFAGLSSCFGGYAEDAGYHQREVEEWHKTRTYDPVTGQYFHSGDVHSGAADHYVAPSRE